MHWNKLLLLTHAAVAIPLIGSSVHNGLLSIRNLLGRPTPVRLRRLYPQVTLALYLAALLLGSIIYPAFRVEVRAAHLDVVHPWATGLFEIKEHWVALGIPLVIAQVLLPSDKGRAPVTRFRDLLGVATMIIVVWAGVVGLGLVVMEPL